MFLHEIYFEIVSNPVFPEKGQDYLPKIFAL